MKQANKGNQIKGQILFEIFSVEVSSFYLVQNLFFGYIINCNSILDIKKAKRYIYVFLTFLSILSLNAAYKAWIFISFLVLNIKLFYIVQCQLRTLSILYYNNKLYIYTTIKIL